MPLFKRGKKIECGVCGRHLTLLEWEDLRKLPENPSYRCETCNQVFCFDCLGKKKGSSVGTGSYEVNLVCPRCGSAEIKYALRKPFPETPEKTVRRRARELQAEHGPLVKVECLANNDINLAYKDGMVVDGKLGGQQLLVTCGYAGQGPTQFHAFLVESGFKISVDEIYDKRPPYTLRRE